MDHPLELAARIIDTGVGEGSTNRIINKLSWLSDRVFLVESFSHVGGVRSDEGIVLFDASSTFTAGGVLEELRAHVPERVAVLVYTHGHVDHVGGSPRLADYAKSRGWALPLVVANKAVPERFRRYRMLNDWNIRINRRQFGAAPEDGPPALAGQGEFLPTDVLEPTSLVEGPETLEVGGVRLALNPARGETDDHLWAFLEDERAVFCGDLVIWLYPNAGNPQKVQRYPLEWAAALRAMLEVKPELLVPAHGLPIKGFERIKKVLSETADTLEDLTGRVIDAMNQGKTLNEIIHSVRPDDKVLSRPWLAPLYDDPEFVVRNVWRLYGGWWDGRASNLKPPRDEDLAREVAFLGGGASRLAERAIELLDADIRTAAKLAEWAFLADPQNQEVLRSVWRVYATFADREPSLMAKGILGEMAQTARRRLEEVGAGLDRSFDPGT
jgi:alkyl sulfatase BDS1-like metallo-beta-lactamase superfamily hydrolase